MIQQLFKLMWNSKRNHSLLIVEIFCSFLVLFAVMSFIIYEYTNYVRPSGFNVENVWVIWFENANAEPGYLNQQRENILTSVESFDEVVSATVAENSIPYGGSRNSQSLTNGDTEVWSRYVMGDANYQEVFQIPLAEGAWFDNQIGNEKYEPIIINQRLRDELFGDGKAVGQILIPEYGKSRKVVGVMNQFRLLSDFQSVESCFITPANRMESLLVRVKTGTDAEFEGQLARTVAGIAKGYQVEIERLTDKRKAVNNVIFVPGIIMLIVCGFLIFNVILGLFGILWSNINQRKGEIGTRRAMGATQASITGQFVGEVVVIATFALLLGCFFAVQFPILGVFGLANAVYVKAILSAVAIIYFLVIICAFYPSWQASKIHPAVALHAD
ncbi:MAG: FtsX-like permease family protein [Bacteroidota bacterium]